MFRIGRHFSLFQKKPETEQDNDIWEASLFSEVDKRYIYRVDQNGYFIMVSPAMAELMGYENPVELIGRQVADFWMHPALRMDYIDAMAKNGSVKDWGIDIKRRDGKILTVRLNSHQLFDKHGRWIGYEGYISLDAEGKCDKDSSPVSLEMAMIVFDLFPDPVSLVRLKDGYVLYCNPAWLNQIGLALEKLKRLTSGDLNVHFDGKYLAESNESSKPGEVYENENKLSRREGVFRHYLFSSRHILVGNEAINLCIARDISEQKSIEQNLIKEKKILKILLDISAGIQGADHPSEILRIILENLHMDMDIDCGIIMLRGRDGLYIAAQSGELDVSFDTDILSGFLNERKTVIFPGGVQSENPLSTPSFPFKQVWIFSSMFAGNMGQGVLILSGAGLKEVEIKERELIAAVADVVAGALPRFEMNRSLENEIIEHKHLLAALNAVITAACRPASLHETIENIFSAMLRALQLEKGALYLLKNNFYELEVFAGLPQSYFLDLSNAFDFHLPFFQQRRSLDFSRINATLKPVQAGGNESIISIPLHTSERNLGLLVCVIDSTTGGIEEDPVFNSIGDCFSMAIENVLLSWWVGKAHLQEGNGHLKHMLGNSLEQSLHKITGLAESCCQLAEREDFQDADGMLGQMLYISRQMIKEMCLMIYEYQRHESEPVGFIQAIRERIGAVEARAGVNVHFQVMPMTSLGTKTEQVLFGIINEVLNNSLKHANATNLFFSMQKNKDVIQISINDDGKGFNLDEAGRGKGEGLSIIWESVEKLDGQIEIRSTPGTGTQVLIKVPVPETGRRIFLEDNRGKKIRILIVSDQGTLSDGIRSFLKLVVDFEVVPEIYDRFGVIEHISRLSPDVILLDFSAPETEGIQFARQVCQYKPLVRFIIINRFVEDDTNIIECDTGIFICPLKYFSPHELESAIRGIYYGKSDLSHELSSDGLNKTSEDMTVNKMAKVLTPREIDVLIWVSHGLSNEEIARKLYLSTDTVRSHLGRIMKKLNVKNRMQAVLVATQAGIIKR